MGDDAEQSRHCARRSRRAHRGSGTAFNSSTRPPKPIAMLLEVRPDKDLPLDWAMTQNNLGNALRNLGGRTEERPAFNSSTRPPKPIAMRLRSGRARTAARLGDDAEQSRHCARRSRRAHRGAAGLQFLNEAAQACRDALEVRTRKDLPLQWATTQNNLGAALGDLGGRTEGPAGLHRTRLPQACRDALEVRTRKDLPLQWAMTQNNLGSCAPQSRRAHRGSSRPSIPQRGRPSLSRCAGGQNPQGPAAPMGDDAEQSRRCARRSRRALRGSSRPSIPQRGRPSLSRCA